MKSVGGVMIWRVRWYVNGDESEFWVKEKLFSLKDRKVRGTVSAQKTSDPRERQDESLVSHSTATVSQLSKQGRLNDKHCWIVTHMGWSFFCPHSLLH